MTATPACGTVDYTLSSVLKSDDPSGSPSVPDLFALGGRATFDPTTFEINFNDIANIPTGDYAITIEVRQKATKDGSDVFSDPIYTETHDLKVIACSAEVLLYDTTDTDSLNFWQAYQDKTLELAFGSGALDERIEFKDKWYFPNADGICTVQKYRITCIDNQIDV